MNMNASPGTQDSLSIDKESETCSYIHIQALLPGRHGIMCALCILYVQLDINGCVTIGVMSENFSIQTDIGHELYS